MRYQDLWPETGQPTIEKYAAGFQSGSAMRSPSGNAGTTELGKPDKLIPRGSAEGSQNYGAGIGPNEIRQLVDALEKLDWVVQFKAYLRSHTDPRDQGCEAGLPDGNVGGSAMAYEWAGGQTVGGDNAQPPGFGNEDFGPPEMPGRVRNGRRPGGRPYPWQHPSQATHYSAAASHPGSPAGPLAERYQLQRQVAELEDNRQDHLDHSERRRLLAMAGQKDSEYRAERAYDSARARRYCEMNPGTSYEQALYRLGISEPAPLVPVGH